VRRVRGSAAESLATAVFSRLKGTAEEAHALSPLVPDALVLTDAQATEGALKAARAPRLLHVATHGFFLEEASAAKGGAPSEASRRLEHEAADRIVDYETEASLELTRLKNPLLRSGLGLAGANSRHGGGEDDGLLTALEVTGLDLWGTELVVLSACDTGVGEVRTGDGVYGLRRALVLAGSETQMMSLWPVSDAGTRDLMIAFYKGLSAGEGRSEALRRVQLEMLEDPKRSHPYYWASFIQSGAWGPLSKIH
jgi:CHAT domain-containing protein